MVCFVLLPVKLFAKSTPHFKATRELFRNRLIFNRGQITPELALHAPNLHATSPLGRLSQDGRTKTCTKSTYTANLQLNRLSNRRILKSRFHHQEAQAQS
ncbi:hypothetical protein AVEN_133884-1 [Araneus ventricosus]|uniref:Uncharacterized protein n=1 Tax=Araneus ventricosus TaxID=182803 RepID=A0A4Y2W0T3_ARAVE|nr:hypothetical protein AVEN_133884-1 [Araneus ventricosus]